eukprot:1737832-Pyramimonas_sp.AAC.1
MTQSEKLVARGILKEGAVCLFVSSFGRGWSRPRVPGRIGTASRPPPRVSDFPPSHGGKAGWQEELGPKRALH